MLSKKMKARIFLIGIAMLFFIPILFSWYLVFYTDFKKNSNGVENGKLINPVIELGELKVSDIANSRIVSLKDKWVLTFVVDEMCDILCEEHLYQVRQIRLALGEDRGDVDRLLIAKSTLSWENYTGSFNGQKYLDSNQQGYEELLKRLSKYKNFSNKSIYLIDPFGFLMMEYPAGTSPIGIIKDIERLIRNSK